MKRVTVNEEALENLFKLILNRADHNSTLRLGTSANRFCKSWLSELDPQDIVGKPTVCKGRCRVKQVDLTNPAEVFNLDEEGHNGKWKF